MSKKQHDPPTYAASDLFDSFVRLMELQRTMWNVTRDVFHTDTRWLHVMRRSDIMNVVAPQIFSILQRACELTTLSGIAAFLDDVHFPNRPDRANLVLERIVQDLGPPPGTAERTKVDTDFKRARALATPILEARNKVGAHNDLMMNLKIAAHERAGVEYPLTPTTVGRIDKIMRRFNCITDVIVVLHGPRHPLWRKQEIEVHRLFDILKRGLRKGQEQRSCDLLGE